MENNSRQLFNEILHHISDIDYIKPEDIPGIDLYMDQVLTFLEQGLGAIKRDDDDKSITKTMVNNYTKNQLMPPPDKKKYSKEHMLDLIFIYYMKNFLSMKDIKSILDPINENYFGSDSNLSFDEIYSEIVEAEHENARALIKDVIKKYNNSRKFFSDEQEEDQKRLQDFTFICLLSFDVFIKKMMIEDFIDGLKDDSSDINEE